MNNTLKAAAALAAEELLGSLGLMRKDAVSKIAPALAVFAAGALVGACVAVLTTPMTGDEMLDELEARLHRMRERLRTSDAAPSNRNGRKNNARAEASAE